VAAIAAALPQQEDIFPFKRSKLRRLLFRIGDLEGSDCLPPLGDTDAERDFVHRPLLARRHILGEIGVERFKLDAALHHIRMNNLENPAARLSGGDACNRHEGRRRHRGTA